MVHMQQERRLAPAPLESSRVQKQRSSIIDQSKDQEFLPRNGFRFYSERAHQRARHERDRRLGKETINKPLVDPDEHDKKHICTPACLRLSDRAWFSTHPLARSRFRSIVDDDDVGSAAIELLSVDVTRSGRKSFIPRVAQ
jgi:hypothetical protein